MTDVTVSAGASGFEPTDVVRTWQAQLQSAFGVSEAERSQDGFSELRAGLAAGRYGGLSLTGPVVDAMVVLLERLGWAYSPNRFARVMPHFPEAFDVDVMRDVMARLRFSSRKLVCNLRQINDVDCPALIITDPDNPRVIDFVDGALCLLDVAGNPTNEGIPTGRQSVVVFRRDQEMPADNPRQSWMFSRIRRMVGPIALLFGVTGFINLMVLVTSFTVLAIYDSVIPTKSYDTLLAIMLGLGFAVAIELAFRRLKARLIGRMCGRLEYMVGTSIFGKLLSLPTEMISSVPIGVQMSRLGQFETVRDLFAGPFAAIALEIPFVFMFIGVLFAFGGPIGLIAVVLVIVYMVMGILFLPPLRRRVDESTRLRQERQALLLETAANLRTIRTAGCEEIWSERLSEAVRRASNAQRRAQSLNRLLSTLSGAGVPVAGGATALLGAVLVMNGELSVGVLVAAMIVIWRVLAPIQQAFLVMTRFADMTATVRQIDQMMRIPSVASTDEAPVRRTFSGDIAFDRVSIRYPGTSQPALVGVSSEIKAGELIAVMGDSGAGKTTLLRVILDLYQPQSGIVSVDGINVRQIPNVDLRAAIGYVPHTVTLFHGSIAQNMRLAAPEADDEALRRVARELGVLDAIEALPEGFDTRIDHNVREKLPTGFRQILAIMQAILRDPQILLLDEPAQALDPTIEDHFINALLKRRGRVTTIMVTHRPSHARNADRVMILERGQIQVFDKPEAIFATKPV